MKVATFTKSGNKATSEVTLDKAVFGREVSPELLKQAYVRVLANARQATAKTKTRGEVRGGGKKPWRQKGTGRARTGSIRNPLWRGGGTTFGPTGEQNYSVDMPRKAVRASVAHALSSQAKQVIAIEALDLSSGKTRDALDLLTKLKVTRNGLIVVAEPTPEAARAFANLPQANYVPAKRLTAVDVLNADAIVIDKAGLELLSAWLGGKQ